MKHFLIPSLFWFGLLMSGGLLPGCSSSSSESAELSIPTDPATVAQGEELFVNNCSACHNFQQQAIGPALAGITAETEPTWLYHFIRNAPAMIDSGDARAVKLYQEYQQYMPPFTTLDSSTVLAIMGYLHTQQESPAAVTAGAAPAATLDNVLTDPIPTKIKSSGRALVLEPVAQAPATRAEPPVARINKMDVLPGTGAIAERMFVHDLQGILYEVKDGQFHPYFNLRERESNFIDKPGLGTGFGSFAFHPEFYDNGLLYTTHTEPPGTAPAGPHPADYAFDDSIDVTLQWVLTEWKTDAPAATTFSGESRELLRVNMVTGIHGMQELTFNPTVSPGDASPGSNDYGLLYLSIGDGGATLSGHPELCQDLSRPWGTILRIDPQGNNSANGRYGIPPNNPYAQDGDHQTLGEIFAYGFRNPHRISWDTGGEHTMLISGIGQKNAEELNQGVAGANYGWPQREGTFLIDERGDISLPYPLPPNDDQLGFTYPVAQYDHDEGNAISGGFVYRGKAVPALQGQYVFGDILTGRLFSVASDQLKLGQQAEIRELGLRVDGQPTTLREVTGINRVDLRFGLGFQNELYLFTKSDGRVWKVVAMVEETPVQAGI